MNRITKRDIEGSIKRLNQLTGNPETPYTKLDTGKYQPNDGCFHIDQAYGGFQLVQMMESSGVRSFGGHGTMRECYNRIHAMIDGIMLTR